MKTLIALGLSLIAIACTMAYCQGAEPTTTEEKSGLPLSVEALGAIRHIDFEGKGVYGAGAAVGLKLSEPVGIKARVVSYEGDDHWRGGVVDETSALVEARLFSSANGKLSLSAIGGGHYDFGRGDFGFGVGGRATVNIYKALSLFGQYEVRAWANGPDDGIGTGGLQFSF